MLLGIPVIHGQTRRRQHWRKLSTGDQLEKLDELPWPPPANLICIFSFSGTADEYYVTICLCWFVGNKISIYLSKQLRLMHDDCVPFSEKLFCRWPDCYINLLQLISGPWINIKMAFYQYRKSHCGDKTVVRSSYLHNGIFYTGKMTSSYWITSQLSWEIIMQNS